VSTRTARLLLGILIVLCLAWPFAPVAGAQEATPGADCPAATPEESLAVMRRFFEEGVGGGDLSIFDEVMAPDVIYHGGTVTDTTGVGELQRIYGEALIGFPDLAPVLLSSVAKDGSISVRYLMAGTHTGDFRGTAPTGKPIRWTQATFATIACGQIAEMWVEVSQLDRLLQLGLLPADAPGAAMAGDGPPVPGAAATPIGTRDSDCPAMTPDEVLAVVDRVRAEVYSEGRLDLMPEIFAEGYRHGSANGPDAIGLEDGAGRIGTFVTALPDLAWTFDDVIVQDDRVSARWTTRGTHDGVLAGLAPTGKPVEFTGISTFTVHCGKVIEFQTEMDAAGLLGQVAGDG
jgi:predicted ester cyclase